MLETVCAFRDVSALLCSWCCVFIGKILVDTNISEAARFCRWGAQHTNTHRVIGCAYGKLRSAIKCAFCTRNQRQYGSNDEHQQHNKKWPRGVLHAGNTRSRRIFASSYKNTAGDIASRSCYKHAIYQTVPILIHLLTDHINRTTCKHWTLLDHGTERNAVNRIAQDMQRFETLWWHPVQAMLLNFFSAD